MTTTAQSVLDVSPVIPVVTLHERAHAVPLARALVAGGIRIIEVTLRTDAALQAVEAIADEVPEILVGAGTVCSPALVEAAARAGARFLVSPGSTDRLLDAMTASGLPFLAGTATPSDMLRLVERGITEAKLFPAEAVGGAALLKAVYGPIPSLRFCPTGGIEASTAHRYLDLPNVGCVGGSWIATPSLLERGDWTAVTERSSAAAALLHR